MTDKEWYAQLSTLVLEGIEKINKNKDTWQNQQKIREFIRYERTPGWNKAQIIKTISENVSVVMTAIGYIGGACILLIDVFCWLNCVTDGLGYGFPIVMLLVACLLFVIGLAGRIWYDLID